MAVIFKILVFYKLSGKNHQSAYDVSYVKSGENGILYRQKKGDEIRDVVFAVCLNVYCIFAF